MPSPRYIPAQEYDNPLAKTLSAFLDSSTGHLAQKQESDALSQIYKQYQSDGDNINRKLEAIESNPNISPTTRVNTVNQLLQFQKHNQDLQDKAQKQQEREIRERERLQEIDRKSQDKALEQESNKKIVEDIERRRRLPAGSLEAYRDDYKLAELITRPPKEPKVNQADRPPDEDQLRRIRHVESNPEFESAPLSAKSRMLRNAGVSTANSDSILKPYIEQEKIDAEREKVITKKVAENDASFYQEQIEAIPRIFRTQETIDAANKLTEEGVTGNLWDQAMQTAGLLQYTSDGYRQYASYAKEMVKNHNIRNIIGSQISQMEFGFFRDATISERFSKEANRQILRKEQAALRYEKLYADITKNLVQQNDGKIPERLQEKVNEEFTRQSPKITKEIKQAALDFEAIQNVPKGKVLMYDKKRRPLHVPANEVEKYTKLGASLS